MNLVGSLLLWLFLALSSALLYPVAVVIWAVTAPFDPRLRWLHRFTCLWGSLYTWVTPPWPVTVEGREKVDPGEVYVMVANHLSLLDILVLFRLFVDFKWVSKIENFRLPFIGWNMSLNRYIKLERGNRQSVVAMMRECERTLAAGSSLMMFPEGTRSPSGRLRSFKGGAFQLALSSRRPILPIVMRGTADALPKRGLTLRGRHEIHVKVLDPIPYEHFQHQSPEKLTQAIHDVFCAELGPDLVADAPALRQE